MDTYLILEFKSHHDATQSLNTINDMAASWWVAQGYSVLDNNGVKELIGKNAKTGQDQPNKQRVISWDIIREGENGTFYFASLSNDPRFPNWKDDYGALGGLAYVERALSIVSQEV
ncbi:MAG: hypothetical protein GW778_07010 [Alphaproteobacteria bacterium]|nr:hypothetical protein [Alphaproteobacteria bacterium]